MRQSKSHLSVAQDEFQGQMLSIFETLVPMIRDANKKSKMTSGLLIGFHISLDSDPVFIILWIRIRYWIVSIKYAESTLIVMLCI